MFTKMVTMVHVNMLLRAWVLLLALGPSAWAGPTCEGRAATSDLDRFVGTLPEASGSVGTTPADPLRWTFRCAVDILYQCPRRTIGTENGADYVRDAR